MNIAKIRAMAEDSCWKTEILSARTYRNALLYNVNKMIGGKRSEDRWMLIANNDHNAVFCAKNVQKLDKNEEELLDKFVFHGVL